MKTQFSLSSSAIFYLGGLIRGLTLKTKKRRKIEPNIRWLTQLVKVAGVVGKTLLVLFLFAPLEQYSATYFKIQEAYLSHAKFYLCSMQ